MLNQFKRNWLDIATAAVAILIGLGVLSDVGPAFISRAAFVLRSVPGAGVIARCDSREVSPFNVQFVPVAQFTAGDGQSHEAFGEASSTACVDDAYNEKPVQVRYNPQAPADAMIGTAVELVARLAVFTLAGAAALVAGLVVAAQLWRNWPRRAFAATSAGEREKG
jgi:hypothetical protein